MALNVKRLRIGLLAGAVLLVVVLAGIIGYGRYKAGKLWRHILDTNGVKIIHETDGYTYVQSIAGKVIYKLHAAKAIQHDDSQWTLHDVVFTFYGKTPGQVDTVYGKDFEYDDKLGVARAIGESQMDLQVPKSVAGTSRTEAKPQPAGAQPDVIHVVTSGLVYLRKLGVAATDQRVDFQYGGMKGSSMGAEFYTDQSTLHLLANVQMDGLLRGAPVHMTALRADMDRTMNVAEFVQPAFYSGDRTAKAAHGVAHFRQDGSMETAEATGVVTMTSGTQQIVATRLDMALNEQSLPQTAKLSGGVTMVDTNAVRPMQGAANVVDAWFDAQGAPTKTVASGGASLAMVQHAPGAPDLRRNLKGQQIVATFVPGEAKGKARISELHATGSARVLGDSLKAATDGLTKSPAQVKTTEVAGDDLRAVFVAEADGSSRLQTLFGAGHTELKQNAPMGVEQRSAGDQLEVAFAPAAKAPAKKAATSAEKGSSSKLDASVEVASAVQTGHVTVQSRAAAKPGATAPPSVTNASGDKAIYNAALNRLVLTGGAHVSDGQTEMTAASLAVDQETGDAEAQGNVVATMLSAAKPGAATVPATSPDAQVTHVLAASAKLQHESKKAEFYGTDAQPAKMWQGASQVEAATLYLDGDKRTMAARPAAAGGVIHAVFAGQASAKPGDVATRKKSASGSVVRVTSQKMDFADLQHEATFVGAVRLDGTIGEVRAQRTVVFLLPPAKDDADAAAAHKSAGPSSLPTPFAGTGGSLDRVVVTGDVQMEEPGRHGTGEELLYRAASDDYVLTGTAAKPPKIVDEKQGTVTGKTLMFGDAGSTIIVAGEPGKSGGMRVRTETEVRR